MFTLLTQSLHYKNSFMKIDNIDFTEASVKKMSETEFIEQYKDQRQHGVSESDWLTWMKAAYAKLNPADEKKAVKK